MITPKIEWVSFLIKAHQNRKFKAMMKVIQVQEQSVVVQAAALLVIVKAQLVLLMVMTFSSTYFPRSLFFFPVLHIVSLKVEDYKVSK